MFSQVFLNFSEINDFSSLSPTLAERTFDLLFKLNQLFFMSINGFSLHSFGFYLILMHFVIPIFIKLWDFLEMCHLYLPLFLLKSSQQLLFPLFLEFFLDFYESSFGSFCLHVFSCLFTIFLMRVEYFPV